MAHLPQLTDAQFEDVVEQLSTLLRLDPNTIEFDDIRAALVSTLAKRESLAGYLEADTIVFLIDAIAAIGVYTQYSIDAAWAEGNLHTALGNASIRAIIRTLGVRQRRKIPAQMTALFTHSGTVNVNDPLNPQTIPAYSTFVVGGNNFFNREPIRFIKRRDFVFHADNTHPWGIWGSGSTKDDTIWVSDYNAHKLFAYNALTGEYDSSKDIDLHEDNTDARGIWGDGTTIWVVNAGSTTSTRKLFAYTISTKTYDDTKDEDLNSTDNANPRGLTQDGVTWWVSDTSGYARAYVVEEDTSTAVSLDRDATKDINLQIISPATTGLWVDIDNSRLYSVSHTRCSHVFDISGEDLDASDSAAAINIPDREFNLVDQNSSPRGIWSNGTTLWVVDAGRAYSYHLETGVRGEQEPSEKTVTLYQGTIRELPELIVTDAQDYARFVSEESNFQVADEDVRVSIGDTALEVVHDPLWRYRNRNTPSGAHQTHDVVQDFTLSDGSLELRFGTQNFGTQLTAGANLKISYVLTEGANAHSYTVNGESVALPAPPEGVTYDQISATVTSVLRNGFNELDVDAYRTVGPLAFAAQHVAIDFAGYRAAALEYPGMIDCLPIRQAHYAPDVLSFTNLIKISLLADDPNIIANLNPVDNAAGTKQYPISDEYWKRFNSFLTARGIASVQYLRNDPVAREVRLKANVHIQTTANEALVQDAVENALRKLFEPRPGILGLTIQRSDIITAIMRSATSILYVDELEPDVKAIHSRTQPVNISSVAVVDTGSGGLAAGTYSYKYTVRTRKQVPDGSIGDNSQYEIGESLPFTISHGGNTEWEVEANEKVTIKFDKPPFGYDIRLYRIDGDAIKPIGVSSNIGDSDQGWTKDDIGNLTFVDSDDNPLKITRSDISINTATNDREISTTDGDFSIFSVGDTVNISGFTTNTDNDGNFQVGSVASDGRSMILLRSTGSFATESPSTNVAITIEDVDKIPAARSKIAADSDNNLVAVPGTPEGFDSTHVFYPQLILDEGAIQIIATNPAVANSVD